MKDKEGNFYAIRWLIFAGPVAMIHHHDDSTYDVMFNMYITQHEKTGLMLYN